MENRQEWYKFRLDTHTLKKDLNAIALIPNKALTKGFLREHLTFAKKQFLYSASTSRARECWIDRERGRSHYKIKTEMLPFLLTPAIDRNINETFKILLKAWTYVSTKAQNIL